MGLHHANTRPDWELTPYEDQNVWQYIAQKTHGVVTPGNLMSITGALLVALGLNEILHADLVAGILFVVIGRLADTVDGVIADRTGTKSMMGARVDAGLDKLLALATLVVLMLAGIVPIWIALAIAAQNLANAVISLVGTYNHINIQPSRSGKYAMFGYWVGIAGFVLANLLSDSGAGTVLLELSRAITLISLAIGIKATLGYADDLTVQKATASPRSEFKRFVVIRNPVSSDSHKAKERIDALCELQPTNDIIILETAPGGREPNAQLLRDHAALLGPQTLLCIAAGDGTINMLLNILLHDQQLSAHARQTPILPLWCGNANDLAYMLNGPWSYRKLRRILKFGQVVSIKPSETTLTDLHDEVTTHTAACYTSFGATAYATWELEHALPRKSPVRRFVLNRWRQEAIAATRALIQAPTFTITGRNTTRRIYERTYLNGSRFARIIGIPLRLTDEKFHRVTIERKDVITLLLHVFGLMSNREIAKKAITHDTFTVHDMVWAQFDGEPVKITNGTKVEISVSRKPFYALSLRLK